MVIAEEHLSLMEYKNTMRRVLSLYYPYLTPNDIDYAIDYSINKRYKQERCVLNNNYTNKKAETTLVEMIDYILERQPISTAWGVLFAKKGTVPNPLIKMIKGFMDLRNIHKKQMFQYPKGSEDFQKYNLLQLLDKIDANGTLN